MTTAPPQNLAAEEAVLGAMLLSGATAEPVIADVRLEAEDFYRDRHRIIYRAITELRSSGGAIETLTVSEALARSGNLEEVGGPDILASLAAKVPAPGNASHYAKIVKKNARLRDTDTAAKRVQEAVAKGHLNGEVSELIETLRLAQGQGHRSLRARAVDLTRVRPIEWLWQARLPLGYLSLLLGAEGVGKGTLTAWVIARVTRGELPGDLEGKPARVLVVGDEDSFDAVVVPRLYAAGADLSLVEVLDEQDDVFDVRRDTEGLRDLVRQGGHRLAYFDALLDALGPDVDDWRSKAVRDALRPLRRAAQDLGISVLASLHPNKGARSTFRDLVSGSHAFNASSRSSLLLATHPEDEDRRVLVRGKGNLSAAPRSLEFEIEGRDLDINGYGHSPPLLVNPREGLLRVEDLLQPDGPAAPVKELLATEIDNLAPGGVQTTSAIAACVGRDASDGSVRRALEMLAVEGRWEKVKRGSWQRVLTADDGDASAAA